MSIIAKPKEGWKETGAFALALAFAYLVVQTVEPSLVDSALNLVQVLVSVFLGARVSTKVGDAFATAKARSTEAQANAVIAASQSPKP